MLNAKKNPLRKQNLLYRAKSLKPNTDFTSLKKIAAECKKRLKSYWKSH